MTLPIEMINRTQALLGSQYAMLEQALQVDVPVTVHTTSNLKSPYCLSCG